MDTGRPPRVLVIDDEEVILHACRRILEGRGYQVETEADPFAGRDRALREAWDAILLDVRMPELSGIEILTAVRERRSDLEVIVITGYSSIESAVQAVKLGAFDYLPKPFTPEELRGRVQAAVAEVGRRRAQAMAAGSPQRRRLIGDSEAMARVRALIARVAPSDATVLVAGESGTGKELAAIEIHEASRRRDQPLVSLDCSALAPSLLESELFGHVKGSFTGALATKPGLFEVAHRGTLFLDEVASLSPEIQGKLLRVLESGEIKPVGGVEARRVDIRLIAATNRDLAALVARGTFREDLYYRLDVVPLPMPALRERPGDVPVLAQHFLARCRRPQDGERPLTLSPEVVERLTSWPWPGNVRELRNLVERLVVTTEGDTVRLEHLPPDLAGRACEPAPAVPRTNDELKAAKRRARDRMWNEIERAFVIEALRRAEWNVSRAARETGLARPNFHALMRKHGVRAGES